MDIPLWKLALLCLAGILIIGSPIIGILGIIIYFDNIGEHGIFFESMKIICVIAACCALAMIFRVVCFRTRWIVSLLEHYYEHFPCDDEDNGNGYEDNGSDNDSLLFTT